MEKNSVIKPNTQNSNIRNLQTMLRVISNASHEIPPVVPDGIYGAQTAASVRSFQQAAGLPQTGSTDEKTWTAVSTAYRALAPETMEPAPLRILLERDQVLELGSRNTHVYLLQALLLALSDYYINFPALTVTGLFDPYTEQAVRSLQVVCDLPVTGKVDRNVWRHLAALYRLAVGNGIKKK